MWLYYAFHSHLDPQPTYPPARGGTVSEKLLRTPLSLSNQHDDDDEKPQITKKSSDYDNHHDYDDDDDDLIMMINPSTRLTPNLNPSLHMAWQFFFTQQYKKKAKFSFNIILLH